jgi:ankyrin repeat protein
LESILNARNAGSVDVASSLPSSDLLRIGAFLGDRGLVERSLFAGADIDGEGFGKMTALHWAVARDKVDIARFLVDRGSQHHKTNECSWDLFDLAICNKAPKTLALAREMGFSATGVAFSAMLKRWKIPTRSELEASEGDR